MHLPDPDGPPADDWALSAFYDLVPEAYELDLLEEARRERIDAVLDAYRAETERLILSAELEAARDEAISGMGYDAHEEPDPEAPTVTQAQFMVERMLGGEVLDDPRS